MLIENAYGVSTPLTWDVAIIRNLKDWEVVEYENKLCLLSTVKIGTGYDKLSWNLCKKGSFSVKSLYRFLADSNASTSVFPHKII